MNRRHWLGAELFMGVAFAAGTSFAVRANERGASTISEEAIDSKRHNRKIPVKVRWPSENFGVHRPLAIFSHGLGGSMNGGERFAEAWVKAGMVVVHIQHLGSDTAALRSSPRAAMAPEQLVNRAEDVKAVLDFVEQSSAQTSPTGWGRIDPSKIGVSGHSFGSRTVLAIAGELFPNAPQTMNLSDPRPKAFIALSPFSSGGDPEAMRRNRYRRWRRG
jgi:predicted dienelactone hydrolase